MQVRNPFLVGLLSVAVVGCGDSKNLADPVMIPGGGVGDGAIAGRVNVFVIDSGSEEPVASAKVLIGEPGEEPLEGLTDSAGLFTIDDDSLSGPTTITAVADDYVAATWFGVNGVNLTLGIDLADESSREVDKATLSGTIAGWDEMVAPADDHVRLALIGYSQTDELGDPENEIRQPSGIGWLPPNACYATALASECDWRLVSRAGTIAVAATILDLDTKGTETESDDTVEVVGYAYKLDLQVEDGVDQSGLTLARTAAEDLVDVTVTLPDAPGGFDSSMALVGVELGASGIMMIAVDPEKQDTLPVPGPTGDFAEVTYRAIALAHNEEEGEDDDDDDPMTGSLLHDLADVSGGISFGEWLPLPTSLAVEQGEYSFSPVEGAAFHAVSLRDPDGDKVWEVGLFDGRTSFTLPGITPNPVPTGELDIIVTAFEAEIDLMEFTVDELSDVLSRMAKARDTVD